MPGKKSPETASSSRERRSSRVRSAVPDPRLVQKEVEEHVRTLFRTVANPGTMLAGLHAVQALRQAIEAGARDGPNSPQLRAALRDAERAALTAVREATSAMLAELGPPGTRPVPKVSEREEGLVEVQVQRNEAADLARPNPERTTARERPTPRPPSRRRRKAG